MDSDVASRRLAKGRKSSTHFSDFNVLSWCWTMKIGATFSVYTWKGAFIIIGLG